MRKSLHVGGYLILGAFVGASYGRQASINGWILALLWCISLVMVSLSKDSR